MIFKVLFRNLFYNLGTIFDYFIMRQINQGLIFFELNEQIKD